MPSRDAEIFNAIRTVAKDIEGLAERELVSSGHVTVKPSAVRLTLFRGLDEENVMHIEQEISFATLQSTRLGSKQALQFALDKCLNLLLGNSSGS